jgi:hypothetical protein
LGKLIVTTPTPLAREILRELERSGEAYKVYALGALHHVRLPPGSKVARKPSYFEFRRYLDDHPEITEIYFVAKLNAGFRFWGEALIDGRALKKMIMERRLPSASLLLELIAEDISARSKTIRHPHGISKKFKLGSEEQINLSGSDLTNDLRGFMIDMPRKHRVSTIEETWLLGVKHNQEIKGLGSEWFDTANVLRKLKYADLSEYARIVLYKYSNDNTNIVYPVIGVTTIQDAIRYGITDILITADCVIQAKAVTLTLAEDHGISIRILS